MRILLDENLPTGLKYHFESAFEVKTVRDMSWLGKKNGELLGLATGEAARLFCIEEIQRDFITINR